MSEAGLAFDMSTQEQPELSADTETNQLELEDEVEDEDEYYEPEVDWYRPNPKKIKDWNFQESDAEELKSLGRNTAERAKFMVERQENVLRNIEAKLLTDPTFRVAAERELGHQKASSSQLELSVPRSGGAPLDCIGAAVVARRVAEREQRTNQFEKRRQILSKEAQENRERLQQQQDSVSARLMERQKACSIERLRKKHSLNSSRKEQQKLKRELEKARALVRDAFYQKNGSGTTLSSCGTEWPLGMSGSLSLPSLRATTESNVSWVSAMSTTSNWSGGDPFEEKDIYSSTLQSRAVYEGTMENWKQYVSENEAKTEKYWRQMLQNDYNAVRGDQKRASKHSRRSRTKRDTFERTEPRPSDLPPRSTGKKARPVHCSIAEPSTSMLRSPVSRMMAASRGGTSTSLPKEAVDLPRLHEHSSAEIDSLVAEPADAVAGELPVIQFNMPPRKQSPISWRIERAGSFESQASMEDVDLNGSFKPRKFKESSPKAGDRRESMPPEMALLAVRTSVFKNDHRKTLGARQLRQMQEFAMMMASRGDEPEGLDWAVR